MKNKLIMGALAVAAFARSAAAAGDGLVAPAFSTSTDWVAVCYAAAALVLISVVGFKSSGRTHLD